MKTSSEIVTARLRAMSRETFTNSLTELKSAERESVKTALTELDRLFASLSDTKAKQVAELDQRTEQ